ncbi:MULTISPECIES: EAL domain-containing protein [unclassified Clostridioides]|uniref:EAL domain-containing protein n=1 Tax=unclassified Clostridioides TaxID=2635829 RepID=UPI0038AE757D
MKLKTFQLILIVCMIFLSFPIELDSASDKVPVKVGYYDDGDYMSRNENGEYIGFNFEYLQEINKYTNWKYEIVDCKSWENAFEMLKSGEIDVLPSVYYTKERTKEMLFPTLPMCNIYTTLNVRVDDTRYDYEDFDSFQDMKVGVISNSKDAENFKKYCKTNDFKVQIVSYKETNDLLRDLENGNLDGVAITHLGRTSTFKSVAQFSPEPLYTVVSNHKPNLLSQLNSALNTLTLRNSSYETKLYNKYFSISTAQKPVFTKDEQEYIQQSGEISAVYDATKIPLEYSDSKTGEFSGVVADLFKVITNNTGLKFRFVSAKNYNEALQLSKDSSISVVCGMENDYINNQKNNIRTTQYYLHAPVVLVSGENENENEIKKVAAVNGSLIGENITKDGKLDRTIEYYNSPKECFDAVLKNKVDAVYVNTYIADYLLSNPRYEKFSVSTLTNYAEEISIGISDSADSRLFSILDKCIQYMSTEEMDRIILKNTINQYDITWQDIIHQHPMAIIGGIIIISAIIIILLSFLLLLKSKNNKRIESLLYRDSLTGIWNLNKFSKEAIKSLRNAEGGLYVIVYLDIKQFRMINDTLGFSEGDEILCALAKVLQNTVSSEESCARVSADQFVMLLKYNSWDCLKERLFKIDTQLNDWIEKMRKTYQLILVFGVYIVNEVEKHDISLMLDLANYARRNTEITHRSCIVLYDMAMREEGLHQRNLTDRMQIALEHGEFIPYFQPKVDMNTNRLVGSEALVRWNYPDKGIISPGEFIPYFEKNGFVVEIDFYIYEEVCKMLKRWMDLGLNISPVSCNFSRIHFNNEGFSERLIEIADSYKIPHKYLEIEVTESIFIENLNQILSHFNQLKESGFPISIDDFGSGYSSLGLLQQFSIDIIKLDRTFIQTGMHGSREQAVVCGVVNIAKELNMKVICEGVESIEQVRILKEIGCYLAQGYFYAKPMPQDDFEQLLKNPVLEIKSNV